MRKRRVRHPGAELAELPGQSRKPCPPVEEMRSALRRLDARLADAVTAFDAFHGGPITDRFRGLVITPEQCAALLRQEAATSLFSVGIGQRKPLWPNEQNTWARRLILTFGLDQFDLDVLLIAVASEFDLRYERLFAYLQDDVTRKLVLNANLM